MRPEEDYAQAVAAWWKRSESSSSEPARQIENFCQTFAAVWSRAKRTLGDATMKAIGDRALFEAAEEHPLLQNFSLHPDGIRVSNERVAASQVAQGQLKAALCAALTRFFVVLGSLTADILTPALFAELNAFPTADSSQARENKPPRGDGQEGEA